MVFGIVDHDVVTVGGVHLDLMIGPVIADTLEGDVIPLTIGVLATAFPTPYSKALTTLITICCRIGQSRN